MVNPDFKSYCNYEQLNGKFCYCHGECKEDFIDYERNGWIQSVIVTDITNQKKLKAPANKY